MIKELTNEIQKNANKQKALILARFFKTWVWQYWEWDKFHWITVPISRQIVKKYYKHLDFDNISLLLKSEYHEERFIWAIILVEQFKKWDKDIQKKIFDFYIANAQRINNWDLVDLSAPNIVWDYLYKNEFEFSKINESGQLKSPDSSYEILYKLTKSSNLWERRIAILSTFTFIRKNEFSHTLKICELLLGDKHDLIHKATGWMLREIGKRNEKVLTEFLDKNILKMPRTMLRYSIEKFEESKRKTYLNK